MRYQVNECAEKSKGGENDSENNSLSVAFQEIKSLFKNQYVRNSTCVIK